MINRKPISGPCGCLRDCPCYPDCDRMLDEGRLPGKKEPGPKPGPAQPPRRPPVWLRAEETRRTAQGQNAVQEAQDPDAEAAAPCAQDDLAQLVRENEADWQKLKDLYPDMARILLAEVEETCDRLEYEGSMMYDEMPDKVRLQKMTETIYDRMKDRYPVEETDDRDEMLAMNRERQRRYPPKQNWFSDFIQSLFCQEMFRRRCRNRSCRKLF